MQNSRIFLNSRAMSCSIVMSQKDREGYRREDDPSVNAVDFSLPVDPQTASDRPAAIIRRARKSVAVRIAGQRDLTSSRTLVRFWLDDIRPKTMKAPSGDRKRRALRVSNIALWGFFSNFGKRFSQSVGQSAGQTKC